MILKAADPPGRRPAGGVLPARPAMPWRVGALDHSWKPLPCGSGTLPAPRNTTVRALLPRGDVPGNPIDAHLLQMISPELKLVAPASQGLASRCKATRQQRSLRGQERHCIGLSPIRSLRARRRIILSVGLILSKKKRLTHWGGNPWRIDLQSVA